MRYYKDLTSDEISKIIDYYQNQNMGSDSIAKLFDTPANTILRVLKKANIKRRTLRDWTDDEEKRMCDLYLKGHSPRQISEIFSKIDHRKITAGGVKSIVKRNNVKLKTASQAHTKYKKNHDFFEAINTPEKAYFLGFMYADGNNQIIQNTSSLSLNEKDKEILLKLGAFIFPNEKDLTAQVKIIDRTKENKGISATLHMNSKKICLDLNQAGCIPNKTFLLKFPDYNILNPLLHSHFIRGYFDGDGSLYYANDPKHPTGCKIISTKEFLEGIKQILKPIGISCHISINKEPEQNTDPKNTFILNISGNRNILKFTNFIYDNSSLFLKRKYERYLEFKNKMSDIDKKSLDGTQGFSKTNYTNMYPEYNSLFKIDNEDLTGDYIATLSDDKKHVLSHKILNYIKSIGLNIYSNENFDNDFQKLLNYEIDVSKNEINSNNNLCTKMCKIYCWQDYFATKFNKKPSVIEVFEDEKLLLKVIKNRLKLDWKKPNDEKFNISIANLIAGAAASGVIYNISIFKPIVAKYLCEKFSQPNDLVYDYSAGWGTRMLGVVAAKRRYIGTDPLTTNWLENIKNDLKLNNVTLFDKPSEELILSENSIDFSFSSPPYNNLECYSNDVSQAYSKGNDYFYEVYWRKTLENIKIALKTNKKFALNINLSESKMLEIAKEYFDEPIQEIKMYLNKSNLHVAKKSDIKYEPIYIFNNQK